MTAPSNGRPQNTGRHFIDETKEIPAVNPRHARPDTSELRAQRPRPPMPQMPSREEVQQPSRTTRAEDRKDKRPPWYRRWFRGAS